MITTSRPPNARRSPGATTQMRAAAAQVRVEPEGGQAVLALVDGGPVVDEVADRQPLGELQRAAHVVAVEVGHDQVVDPRHPGIGRRRRDAVGVAAIEAGPAGVDEHRFARRRHEERRLASLHVDHVDVERVVRSTLGGRRRRGERETEQQRGDGAHGAPPARYCRTPRPALAMAEAGSLRR